jgi:membrane AbrB-like protein
MKPDQKPSITAAPATALGRRPLALQWLVLLGLSLAIAGGLEMAGIPAALLMGPMAAGGIVGLNGGTIRLPRLFVLGCQALIGTMIAGSITGDIVGTFFGNWPLFLGIVVCVITMSTLSGYLITRLNVLPGTTAIWGCSAGAATTMMVMAEAYGADARLVAFMQYLRVVFVAAAAALVARYWAGLDGAAPAIVWFEPIHALSLSQTLLIAMFGGMVGWYLKIPAGVLLMPFLIGAVLSVTGSVVIHLPEWLLAISYAALGWNIGLGFTRPVLAHARRVLLPTVASILVLMGISGLLAFILTRTAGIDPLTAYLATSPGGMDSIAIIAASSNVDVSFVMALQTARLLIVMAMGPPLARFVARHAGGGQPAA